MDPTSTPGRRIAVVGSGISGLSSAWLLSQRHDVTLFEQADRLGGHSNTVLVDGPNGQVAVDTGFIVFNRATYPNLVALFDHLGVATREAEMSFSVSRHNGGFEYAGTSLGSLFAQPINAVRPAFWSMLSDLRRFYATAPRDLDKLAISAETLGDYLDRRNYGVHFKEDHLLPMAAAIWSASIDTMLDYPAASFIRFFENHGLLKLSARPAWQTVVDGSRRYVLKLAGPLVGRIQTSAKVVDIRRNAQGVSIRTADGDCAGFDDVVIASHADETLEMLGDATDQERRILGAFRYTRNRAVLHTDAALMPKRRSVWSSWNYIENAETSFITYWMNRLQSIATPQQFFVTLNPPFPPAAGSVLRTENYAHPVFDAGAIRAQKSLWSLQGQHNTWYCGAFFGAGFHEDGLQAGLAVAEDLGRVQRPWRVENDSGRISRGRRHSSEEIEAAS